MQARLNALDKYNNDVEVESGGIEFSSEPDSAHYLRRGFSFNR